MCTSWFNHKARNFVRLSKSDSSTNTVASPRAELPRNQSSIVGRSRHFLHSIQTDPAVNKYSCSMDNAISPPAVRVLGLEYDHFRPPRAGTRNTAIPLLPTRLLVLSIETNLFAFQQKRIPSITSATAF
jgi:hypothetical protein